MSANKRDFLVVNSFAFPAEIPQWQGYGLLSVSHAFLVILTGARFLILQRCPSRSMSYSSLNAWEVGSKAWCYVFSGWSQKRLFSLESSQRMSFSQDVLSLESSIIISTIEVLWAKTHVKELFFKPLLWYHLGPLCTRNLIKASFRKNKSLQNRFLHSSHIVPGSQTRL